jgi:hypothetical protein
MASPDDIDEVRFMLGPNAEAEGWTDEKIGDMLDAGSSPAQIAQQYWESQMASTATLVDVSESGSSRRMSQVSQNAANLANYWGHVAAQETTTAQQGAVSREIRRV